MKVYKNKYPFKLAVPSFIYPADYETNIEKLGPCFDEIELLFMEKKTESLPDKKLVERLSGLSEKHDITYNIHTPTDLEPGSIHKDKRQEAADTLTGLIDLTKDLPVTSYTVHLPYYGVGFSESCIKQWEENVCECMVQVLSCGIEKKQISLENLDYPVYMVEKIVEKLGVSLCFDIGHYLGGVDDKNRLVYPACAPPVSVLHLQGVLNGKDHQPLEYLSESYSRYLKESLMEFTGTVCMEVFSEEHLVSSLKTFNRWCLNK